MKRTVTIGRFSVSLILVLSVAVLVLSSIFCFLMSDFIQYRYPDRPIVPDLLFDVLPFIPALEFTTDPIIVISIILMLYFAFGPDRKRSGYYFFTVGIGYVFRGILMILTPLGRPTGNLDTYGAGVFLHVYQHGLFPSGHAYLAAVIFFLIDRARTPRLKIAAGILCICEVLTALLSHGHYSIDLVGGVMLAFLTHYLMNPYKDRFLEAPPDGKPRHGSVVRKRKATP